MGTKGEKGKTQNSGGRQGIQTFHGQLHQKKVLYE
jgi:hypothetical protein